MRRGSAPLGTLRYAGTQGPEARGGAARAHKGAAGSSKSTGRMAGPEDVPGMAAAAGLARRLQAALREAEPR